jgi:hypothetical protein
MAYCMEEEVDLELEGGSSSWTEPQAPLPRRRPIVHGLLGLPIVWPWGDDIIILLVLFWLNECYPTSIVFMVLAQNSKKKSNCHFPRILLVGIGTI